MVAKKGTDVESLAREVEGRGVPVLRKFNFAVRGFAAQLSVEEISRLRAHKGVKYLEKSRKLRVTAEPWGIDRIDQRELPLDGQIERGITGAGVTAYVIDTGVMVGHSEFGGRASAGYSVFGGSGDCNGHGTHVAGTVGGSTVGVATEVKIVSVRVLDCNGSGTIDGVIQGINWVIEHHRKGEPAVANMSLGSGKSQALNDAVEAAISDGIVFAVAAGNSDADACNTSPASADSAITVGATTRGDARASYSNYGSCLDLFAPGSDVYSAAISGRSDYATLSGTSMASPHVAGVAALYLGENPEANPAQVAAALRSGSSWNVVRDAGPLSPNIIVSTLAITNPDAPSPDDPPYTPPSSTTTTTVRWQPPTTIAPVLPTPVIDLQVSGRDVIVNVSPSKRFYGSLRVEFKRGWSRLQSKSSTSFTYLDEDRATASGTVTYTVTFSDWQGNEESASASIRINPPSPPRVRESDIYVFKDGYKYTAVIPFNSYYSADTVALYCGYSDVLITKVSARTGQITLTSLTSNLYHCRLWGLSATGAADDYNTFDLRRY